MTVEIVQEDCYIYMDGMARTEKRVDMIITSPPYFNAKEYIQYVSYQVYLSEMFDFLQLSFLVLKNGGRIAINVPDMYDHGDKLKTVYADFVKLVSDAGFTIRGSIVWDKGTSAGRCSWGSWLSSSNPCLIDEHEMIIIAHKLDSSIGKSEKEMTPEQFMEYTKSIWKIKPAHDRNHPAPFPVEIPERLIKLYTKQNDTILDPFAGSMTTGVACVNTKRNFIGIEVMKMYVEYGRERINKILNQPKQLEIM